MKKLYPYFLVTIAAILFVLLPRVSDAVTTRFNSDQLAATASNGYVLTSDATWNVWTDPATLPSSTGLDEAYDNGNTIDYTGAADPLDAIILSVTSTAEPSYFIQMLYDDQVSYNFATEDGNNTLRIYDDNASVAHFLSGMSGSIQLNMNQEVSGDFGWESVNHTNAILADSSADTISIVGTEVYIGDVDTQTNLVIADGDGEYITFENNDTTTSVSVDIDLLGSWTTGYVFTMNDLGANAWAIIPVDPAAYKLLSGSIDGYVAGVTAPIADGYINLDPAAINAYAGTGVNDSLGYGLPWNVSIVGISANYTFADDLAVGTIDVIPYEDGAAIHANCKLTLPETGVNIDSASATFAPGTYTVTADQTLGIYIDVDSLGLPRLTDLIVTIYYTYSL